MKFGLLVLLLLAGSISGSVTAQVRHINPPAIIPPPRPVQNVFIRWTPSKVRDALREEGLEAADIQDGFTVGPDGAKESIFFIMPSFGQNTGGVIASFSSDKKVSDSVRYYLSMNDDSDTPGWWVFKNANIMLLVSGRVPEMTARKYQRVLQSMK